MAFAAVVETCSAQIALCFKDKNTTYAELDRWSDELASAWPPEWQPGRRLGLCLQKSDLAVATILALLKRGFTYVPLDPTYPAERLSYFVRNCSITDVIVDEIGRQSLARCQIKDLQWFEAGLRQPCLLASPWVVDARVIAYIIHTSGSTGQPKGVMIEQRSIVRQIQGSCKVLQYDSSCRSALFAPLSFDSSVEEIFLAILTGGCLIIVPEEIRKDPQVLHAFLVKQQPTHLILPPALLLNFPRETWERLRMLGFGGDTIDEGTADWWARRTRLFSLYGPTETTVQASVGEILPGESPRIIGKPQPGYKIYLLNPLLQMVPLGAIGEIHIGGEQAARWLFESNRIDRRAFCFGSFAEFAYGILYRSGDRGQLLADGTIEFLGRVDHQVKLRGFRIELGEIESHLAQFPHLEHVVCVVKGRGENRYLVAYYVADRELSDADLRVHLEAFVPEYMIPNFFVRLAALPMTPNGKVDRKALPEVSSRVAKNPPHPGLEFNIARIWEDILQMKGISRDESFFHLGGNSLLVVRLQADLREQLGLEFAVADFYGNPTIEFLSTRKRLNFIELAVEDSKRLAVEAPTNRTAPPFNPKPKRFLLTGASGFLGIFILAELCQKAETIYCILRVGDAQAGLTGLQTAAASAGVVLDLNKIKVVTGDFAEPGLGLEAGVYEELAEVCEAIIHCGAFCASSAQLSGHERCQRAEHPAAVKNGPAGPAQNILFSIDAHGGGGARKCAKC